MLDNLLDRLDSGNNVLHVSWPCEFILGHFQSLGADQKFIKQSLFFTEQMTSLEFQLSES